MIGQTVGQYRIIEKLGEGGMGVVYKAEDTRLKRFVALKFLPHHLTPHDAEKARFLQEAQSASALNHPNVCTIYDIKEDDGQIFIVMECVDGVTLRQKIASAGASGFLPLQNSLAYAIQIGDALHEAHTKGIVHRDVKCENIMVNAKDQIKVMDFGLAKLKGSIKLTRTSSTVGTLAYMAPEQIQGGDVDARSDIFSYGVVLFELLTRRMPFRGDHDAAMMYAILHEAPESATKYRPELSPELDRIIGRALEKEPEDRYQHIDDMVSELRRLQKQSSRVSRTSMSGMAVSAPSESPSQVLQQPVAAAPRAQASVRPRWRTPALAIVAAALLAAAGFYFLRPASTLDSLAVLPFVNVGADPNTEYLSDGMTESIINSLTRIPQLRVVPRSTVFRFKGKDADPQDIGNQLKVAVVLTGRVVQRGDELSVQLDLVDVKNQSQLWGEQYRRKTSDVIALQEEIVREVSQKLQLTLTGDTRQQLVKRFTENPEAYKLYLQGRYYWNKRRAAEILKAVEYFNQAIATDPGYALAYSGLADCYLLMEQYVGMPGTESTPKAEAAAMKAAELDPSLGEPHAALAFVREFNWDWEGSEREFKKAIALNPKYPTAYHWYAIMLGRQLRGDEAFASLQKALELDPLSPIIILNVALAYDAWRKDTATAMQYFQKDLDMDANFATAYYQRGRIRAKHGNYQAAVGDIEKAVEITGRGAEPLSYLAYCYAGLGRTQECLAIAHELESRYAQKKCAAYNVAKAYTGLHDAANVFKWLERDVEDHSGWIGWLAYDYEWREYRSDPRYAALVNKVGLPLKPESPDAE
jgi:serine/threonine-protein kinase